MKHTQEWNDRYGKAPEENFPWSKPRTKLIDNIISKAKISKSDTILEVGCALGANTIYLNQQGYKTDGIDVSDIAIKKAQQHASDLKINTNLKPVDISTDPKSGLIDQNKYSVIIDLVTSQFISDEEKQIYKNRLKKTLSPRGKFILYTYAKDSDDGSDLGDVRPFIKRVARTPKQIEDLYGDSFHIQERIRQQKPNGEKLDLYIMKIK